MHDSITNYINAEGLKSKKAPELLRGFEDFYYNDLKKKGFLAQMVKLDNKISKTMVQLFDEKKDYRLVPICNH